MSGPFETARSAFYQLTIPDRSWPEKEREAYLGSLGDLLGTTIHEVYPGHFVQGPLGGARADPGAEGVRQLLVHRGLGALLASR